MTQVRYFGFVKAEEPWTGNQFKMYAGKRLHVWEQGSGRFCCGVRLQEHQLRRQRSERVKIPLREDGSQGFLLWLRERRRGAVKEGSYEVYPHSQPCI